MRLRLGDPEFLERFAVFGDLAEVLIKPDDFGAREKLTRCARIELPLQETGLEGARKRWATVIIRADRRVV